MTKSDNTSDLIDTIEYIRKANNIHWMKILRIAMEHAPDQTRVVLAQINENDKRISKCLSKL